MACILLLVIILCCCLRHNRASKIDSTKENVKKDNDTFDLELFMTCDDEEEEN